MYQLPPCRERGDVFHCFSFPPGCCYQLGLRACAAQDVVIKLMIRHTSVRGPGLDPEAISGERSVVILFGEAGQQLHQRPGGVHRKNVAGEKQDGR